MDFNLIVLFSLNILTKKMTSDRLYRFVLNGFNIKKYWEECIPHKEDETQIEEYLPHNLTLEPVSDIRYDPESLKYSESDKYIRYMGQFSDKHKLWITDVDLLRHTTLPMTTERRCNHCHHTFDTVPFGCPIHYINLGENTNRAETILSNLSKRNFKLDKNSEIFIILKKYFVILIVWLHGLIKKSRKIFFTKSVIRCLLYLFKN